MPPAAFLRHRGESGLHNGGTSLRQLRALSLVVARSAHRANSRRLAAVGRGEGQKTQEGGGGWCPLALTIQLHDEAGARILVRRGVHGLRTPDLFDGLV